MLFTNPTAVPTQGRVAALTALGGIGKTTLARQYSEKFWRCYPQMFWVDCRRNLDSEFALIHDIVRPDPQYAELKDADKAAWVREELTAPATHSGQRGRRREALDPANQAIATLSLPRASRPGRTVSKLARSGCWSRNPRANCCCARSGHHDLAGARSPREKARIPAAGPGAGRRLHRRGGSGLGVRGLPAHLRESRKRAADAAYAGRHGLSRFGLPYLARHHR